MTDVNDLSAQEVVRLLDLTPHPEGGFYRETFRDARLIDARRAASTAIYYLLPAGQISAWHRVDAAEIWHFYAGAPLELKLSPDGARRASSGSAPILRRANDRRRSSRPASGRAAKSLGAWTLVGCTVAPAFEFARFELAPAGFSPGGG